MPLIHLGRCRSRYAGMRPRARGVARPSPLVSAPGSQNCLRAGPDLRAAAGLRRHQNATRMGSAMGPACVWKVVSRWPSGGRCHGSARALVNSHMGTCPDVGPRAVHVPLHGPALWGRRCSWRVMSRCIWPSGGNNSTQAGPLLRPCGRLCTPQCGHGR